MSPFKVVEKRFIIVSTLHEKLSNSHASSASASHGSKGADGTDNRATEANERNGKRDTSDSGCNGVNGVLLHSVDLLSFRLCPIIA
jgi:hypothetical protein